MPNQSDKRFCVYRIRHIATDETIYIGKTRRPRKRWGNHCNAKRTEHLRTYMLEHGGFQAYELVPLRWFTSETEAYADEKATIIECLETCPNLLNLTTGGFGGSPNRMSEIHRVRLSRLSVQERADLTKKANEAVRGKPVPPEVRAYLSTARKQWYQDHPEKRAEVSARRLGVRHTAEARAKMGAARRKLTDEQVCECRRLHGEGLSMKGIGARLGVGVKSVFNAVHGHGVYACVPTRA